MQLLVTIVGALQRDALQLRHTVQNHQLANVMQQPGDKQPLAVEHMTTGRNQPRQHRTVDTVAPKAGHVAQLDRDAGEGAHRRERQHQVAQFALADDGDRPRDGADVGGEVVERAVGQAQQLRRQRRVAADHLANRRRRRARIIDHLVDPHADLGQRGQLTNTFHQFTRFDGHFRSLPGQMPAQLPFT
jgi:hypothetical protein